MYLQQIRIKYRLKSCSFFFLKKRKNERNTDSYRYQGGPIPPCGRRASASPYASIVCLFHLQTTLLMLLK